MSIWQSLSSLFQTEATQPVVMPKPYIQIEADKMMQHLFSIVTKPELIREFSVKYQQAQELVEDTREMRYIPLYFELEEFITKSKPPVITKEYTQKSLREELKTVVNLSSIGEGLRVILSSEEELYFYVFKLGIRDLASYISLHLGSAKLLSIMTDLTKGTPFEKIRVTESGLDFSQVNHKMSLKDLSASFKSLYKAFYLTFVDIFGEQTAIEVLTNTFIFIKISYGNRMALNFLYTLPDGVLEKERLSLSSKEELERMVEERTKKLNEEQVRLEASINSLNIGYIMTDKSYNLITINPTAKRLLCINPKAPITTLVPQNPSCTLQNIEDQLLGVLNLRTEIERCVHEHKNIQINDVYYNYLYLRIFLSPIIMFKDESEVIGVVILIEDVTEAKILERSRDEFFSIASHELRTPLTAIRGNTAMIMQYYAEQIKDPNMKEMIEDIHGSSLRLIDIVNDFLNMSRLEQRKMIFKSESVDLAQTVQEVINEYQTTGSERKLYLKLEPLEKPLPPAAGDKNKVKEVLINLIGNGLKFTTNGGVSITASLEGQFVKIAVKDTGMGIAGERKDLLFRKFQQAGESLYTRDTTKGTGLGLYISKLLMEGMGGKIYLEQSEVNKGSTFTILLPIASSVSAK